MSLHILVAIYYSLGFDQVMLVLKGRRTVREATGQQQGGHEDAGGNAERGNRVTGEEEGGDQGRRGGRGRRTVREATGQQQGQKCCLCHVARVPCVEGQCPFRPVLGERTQYNSQSARILVQYHKGRSTIAERLLQGNQARAEANPILCTIFNRALISLLTHGEPMETSSFDMVDSIDAEENWTGSRSLGKTILFTFIKEKGEGNCKPHPVSWEVVCSEKKYGGLGLRSAWDNNQAFIAKLGWRIGKGDNALWCRVMQAKYLRGRNFMEAGNMVGASFIWRGIVKCRSVLQQGVRWRIGSGEKVCFWQDAWVGDAPLISSSNEPHALPSLLVSETINPDRDWNLELLHELVPAEIVEKIRAIPLSRNSQLEDGDFWASSMDGLFTVKSAYQLLQAPRNFAYHSTDSWNWIWKLHCAERIRLFVWLLVRGRVLTNSVRFARHMAPSPLCPRCESSNETPIHLLRDCFYAKTVWSLLGFAMSEFFTLDSFPWPKKFSTISRAFRQAEVSRAILFLSAIWLIWKDRNALVFWNHRSRPQELCVTIWQYAKYTEIAMSSSSPVKSRLPRWVRWMPPMEGWYKLNSDGSFNVTSNSGLKLCKSLGIARVVAEMDSLVAVRFIIEKREPDNLSAAILMDIRSLMSEFEECILQHVLREGNAAADFLAPLGHSSPPGRSLLDSPPTGL
ncbi:hypothetical protein SLEP1_g29190 [Rubroshorea leprosula]|uniref:Reverse transcriptase zinc-binding domain-containing protein n=1 Tax=Rubroshorea leprosula TaxID=152421 RepID=A0AAV5K7T9_9ROSI|nr:hypothetical protein SLEP1_g29190 [Rubroshorea leprosula]